jgi:hypothetical protein
MTLLLIFIPFYAPDGWLRHYSASQVADSLSDELIGF